MLFPLGTILPKTIASTPENIPAFFAFSGFIRPETLNFCSSKIRFEVCTI